MRGSENADVGFPVSGPFAVRGTDLGLDLPAAYLEDTLAPGFLGRDYFALSRLGFRGPFLGPPAAGLASQGCGGVGSYRGRASCFGQEAITASSL